VNECRPDRIQVTVLVGISAVKIIQNFTQADAQIDWYASLLWSLDHETSRRVPMSEMAYQRTLARQ